MILETHLGFHAFERVYGKHLDGTPCGGAVDRGFAALRAHWGRPGRRSEAEGSEKQATSIAMARGAPSMLRISKVALNQRGSPCSANVLNDMDWVSSGPLMLSKIGGKLSAPAFGTPSHVDLCVCFRFFRCCFVILRCTLVAELHRRATSRVCGTHSV